MKSLRLQLVVTDAALAVASAALLHDRPGWFWWPVSTSWWWWGSLILSALGTAGVSEASSVSSRLPAPDRRYDTPLAEIGLDTLQRAKVLEWFARKIWVGSEEGSGEREYCCKSYDPLTIELSTDGGGVAHSYVFNFHDGGRHHVFDSLDQLEDWLLEELIGSHEWCYRWGKESVTDVE